MRWLVVFTVALMIYLAYIWRDRFEPESLRGKRVLITGASSGIGEQMAYHYAKFGAKILITARREYKLKEVIQNCHEVGDTDGEYYYYPADMSDINAYKKLIQFAVEKLGGLDYLVLNHIMVVPLGEFLGSSQNLTSIQKLFDINFRAYVHLASHALPHLQASHGSIVVVSSIAGKVPQPYLIMYSASKFALEGFFSGLRQEMLLRKTDVSVTLCILGFIGTENALEQVEKHGDNILLSVIPIAKPEDAALQIIKGGALRHREIYFPYSEAKFATTFRDVIPESMDAMVRFVYKKPE